jgi:hypothetical protein
MEETMEKQISSGLFVFLSFLIWLIATSILRLWGHTFFIPSALIMSVNFLWSLFFLPPLVYGIFRWQNVLPQQRQDAAICLAVPGMLLDVLTTYFFPQVFPNMLPAVDGAFGAWLLWGYAIVLITGLITSRRVKSQTV